MKREENLKYWKKKFLQFYFFSIFKKFIKNSNNIPSISKTIQHTPMTWCTYLQVSRKYINGTDGRMDGQTDGGRCNISRPGPSAPQEITPPPLPQTTPTFEIQNQNIEIQNQNIFKGIEDNYMDIDSNCPSLLFGETTSHLNSK